MSNFQRLTSAAVRHKCGLLALRWTIQWRYYTFKTAWIRRIFHTKHAPSWITALWALGIGVGMASYAPSIPPEFFQLSYVLLTLAVAWSVLYFSTSPFMENKLINRRGKLSFWVWESAATLLIVACGLWVGYKIHVMEVGRELNKLNGILIPANEPDPPGGCTGSSPPYRDSLKFYFGPRTGAMPYTNHLTILKGEDGTVYLAIDRLPNGSAALTARVLGDDGRIIVDINENRFEINRNHILDSLSPPRPDRSTISIKDDRGNILTVRLLNKNSIQMAGKIHLKGAQYVVIDDSGITIYPNKLFFSNLCLAVLHSDDVALLGVD